MSDTSQGPGWWIASDGRWYPPGLHPSAQPAPVTPPGDLPLLDLPQFTASPSDLPQFTAFPSDLPPFSASPSDMPLRAPTGQPKDALASWAPAAAPGGPPPGPPGPGGPPGYFPPAAYGGIQPGTYPNARPQGLPPGAASPGGRFSRGLRLVGVGFRMARAEPGLMLVPVVAFLAQLVIFGVAAAALYPALHAASTSTGTTTADGGSTPVHLSVTQWTVVVVAGVLVMFVTVVSHATIIARVMARFHGQGVSNTQAARAALTKSPQLLAWAFIEYVVMSLLRSISNRGLIGALLGWVLRTGWMLASFFVVPVILFEDKGAVSAIKRSVELCRSRWGENIVGNGALRVIGFAAVLVDVGVAVVLGAVFAPVGVAVGLIGLIVILLVLTVASGAFNAALYWYAVTEQAPGQYSLGDLQAAYRRKASRAGISGF